MCSGPPAGALRNTTTRNGTSTCACTAFTSRPSWARPAGPRGRDPALDPCQRSPDSAFPACRQGHRGRLGGRQPDVSARSGSRDRCVIAGHRGNEKTPSSILACPCPHAITSTGASAGDHHILVAQQALTANLHPDKARVFLQKCGGTHPCPILVKTTYTHLSAIASIQSKTIYRLLNVFLPCLGKFRIGKDVTCHKLKTKPAIRCLKRIKHILEITLATVHCGTCQAIIAPLIRHVGTFCFCNIMINSAATRETLKMYDQIGTIALVRCIELIHALAPIQLNLRPQRYRLVKRNPLCRQPPQPLLAYFPTKIIRIRLCVHMHHTSHPRFSAMYRQRLQKGSVSESTLCSFTFNAAASRQPHCPLFPRPCRPPQEPAPHPGVGILHVKGLAAQPRANTPLTVEPSILLLIKKHFHRCHASGECVAATAESRHWASACP